jgi:hypothetical protein
VIRTNTGSDGNLEVLRLGQSLSGEVTWVEAINLRLALIRQCQLEVSPTEL